VRLAQNTIGDGIFAGSRSIEIFVSRTIRSLAVRYVRIAQIKKRSEFFPFDWSSVLAAFQAI